MVLTPAQITRARGLCARAEPHHADQPRQRAGRVRADRAAPGPGPHQRAAARACRTRPRSRICSARSRRSSFAWSIRQDNPIQAQQSGHVPLGDKLYKTQDGSPILLKREVIVTGDELTQATSTTGQDGPAVNIRLDARGARLDAAHHAPERRPADGGGVHREEPPAGGGRRPEGRPRDVTDEKVINEATIRGVFGPQFEVTG